ncbi:hypothetical protein NPIL_319441 [Nephila pilipes]|uniref:Reverse transcriptase domain-containing protein n=1 Tax=Nephila pilipes TaxID=299642 RepID=A0A8X6TAR1_NEPPI|nr:hypothetical protein NPIL_319441 [Nephila pilipes]
MTHRFKRVLFGMNVSLFPPSATRRKKHVEQFHSEHPIAASFLDFCLYGDDLIAGEDNEHNAFEVSCGAKQIMQKGGMVLRKCIINKSDLMDRWK